MLTITMWGTDILFLGGETKRNRLTHAQTWSFIYKAKLKCFAVYSAHPPGFLAYSDQKYKKI